VRVGLFTDGLAHLERREALSWCAERGIEDLEMGVGTWSPRPHLDLPRLLAEPAERDRLQGELREHGQRLACVNAAGNPLTPISRSSMPRSAHQLSASRRSR
jgi:sugar phosphate isomerase/epimerase